MQYIKKESKPPVNWDKWFTTATGRRSFDYGTDYGSLTQLGDAKSYLLKEQYNLCAYCQQKLTDESASIEHVIPKEFNKELSTNYYNLVAVCKTTPKCVETGLLHCDKEKGSKVIPHLIFLSNAEVSEDQNHHYFTAGADGLLRIRHSLTEEDICIGQTFINVLNLNHSSLRDKRSKDVLRGITSAARGIPKEQKKKFWESTFKTIQSKKSQPFRQYLLIYMAEKLGK